MTVSPSFKQFSKLSLELRELIWQAALASTRIVHVEADPLVPDEFEEDEEKMHNEDLHGKSAEQDDTRSIPEKDMHLLSHRTSQGLDGALKRQSQLHKYGFVSNKPAPNIAHIPFHDPTIYQGFGMYEANKIPASRDVRPLLHLVDNHLWWRRRGWKQAQLHRFGFKTSSPCPKIHQVSARKYFFAEKAIRFRSSAPFSALLHVCRESRQLAIRSGYALLFATRWAPAQTWFNPRTDYLRVHSPVATFIPWKYRAQDRQRVTRLVLDSHYHDSPTEVFDLIMSFKNLEEIVIDVDFPNQRPDYECLLVDCTVPDVLQGVSRLCSNWMYACRVRKYMDAHPSGPPYFDHLVRNMESELTEQIEFLTSCGYSGLKTPKIRYVIVTDEKGRRDFEVIREQFWGERKDGPAMEDWQRFLKDDMDARRVARPPSPFDTQHADDEEVLFDMYEAEKARV